MAAPKICLIYYKALLDQCFVRFFDEHNDFFQNVDGQYVLCKTLSDQQLERAFKRYLAEALKPLLKPYSILKPEYFFVIGAGMPKDNILLKTSRLQFPKKLQKLIDADFPLKYILRENDIRIDVVKFNSVMMKIFDQLFKSTRNVLRLFGDDMANVFFIQHKNLDCYSMFKALKSIYGKSNCINLYAEKNLKDGKRPLVAVNDLIDVYARGKSELNRNAEFKRIIQEVKDFADQRIGQCQNGK